MSKLYGGRTLEAVVADIIRLMGEGKTHAEIRRLLDLSHGTIAGIVRREVRGIREPAISPDDAKSGRHSYEKYVEPWAVYTARKKKEREAAKLPPKLP